MQAQQISLGLFSDQVGDRSNAVGERSAEGDGDVAEQIVRARPRLVRFAWSLTHDPEASEDLAQETVLRALASQWRFQPGTNLKAWLFRILRNVHLNNVRATGSRPALVSSADLRRIADVYRTLPPAFAVPLYLTAIEELTYAEVASILDVPLGTVMSRVYRGRRLLISRLGEAGR